MPLLQLALLILVQLAATPAEAARPPPSRKQTRDNLVGLVHDGRLRTSGRYRSRVQDIEKMFRRTIPRAMKEWPRKRLLIFAHGGMVSTYRNMFQLVRWRKRLLPHHVYPVMVSWRTGVAELSRDLIFEGFHSRPRARAGEPRGRVSGGWDGRVEGWVRRLRAGGIWDRMKANGVRASGAPNGGARVLAREVAALVARDPEIEVHVVGHSAGSVLLGPFLDLLTHPGGIESGPLAGQRGHGVRVKTATLWGAACTMDLLRGCYLDALRQERLGHLALVHLSDAWERRGTVSPLYGKSILYMIHASLEPQPATPIAGLQVSVEADPEVRELEAAGRISLVVAPNDYPVRDPRASRTRRHQDFEYDKVSLGALVARMDRAPAN
jgi:hypothetical protein